MLEQNPQIGETKIEELAKLFLWDPFFPVHSGDSLLHVLLLLSKHRLQVVPVMERSNFQVTGFVTQTAVIHLLLQSSGLEWFDGIADKPLSMFRFESEEQVVRVYGEQNLAECLQIMKENHIAVVAIVDREFGRIIGCMRKSDVYLLLENDKLNDIQTITMEEFIHVETAIKDCDPTIDGDLEALLSGNLRLRNSFIPRMDSPVTIKSSSTLKQTMKCLAKTNSSFSFIVDDAHKPTGIVTIGDMIVQFARPCIDSSIHGGGFFQSALEQAGCHVKHRTLIFYQ